MQIRISDLMDQSCPDEVELGAADRAMAKRVNDTVFAKLGITQPKPRRTGKKTLRTLLLAAVLAALMGTVAYAASGWFMGLKKTEEPVTGHYRAVDADGNLKTDYKLTYPDAGMVLSFEGPAERTNQPEFRCFYLPEPEGSIFGFTDEEGWTTYLTDDGEGASIPFIVSAGNVRAGNHRRIINGAVTTVREELWDDWQVTELTSDYTHCTQRWNYERANYVLLFNSEKGWLIMVSGTAGLDTLEHIARELEIRDSGRPAFSGEDDAVETIGILDPGRG
ncbi:MAG: hypothetical protein IJQ36_07810 [Oscillospiraceae bacterium]|nr:hypothetical protein [Oscillospiraceae bacterium]